ncbi:hypothetical protein R1flu_001968 [Riccia fluitans]|uniref:Protein DETOXIFICATION n=1 Tax=Riccia fluitans TaxID=41844 RepID=A0ABD1Y4S1_9MARC
MSTGAAVGNSHDQVTSRLRRFGDLTVKGEKMESDSNLDAHLLRESTDFDIEETKTVLRNQQQQQLVVKFVEEDEEHAVWDEVKKAFELAWPLSLFNVAGFSVLVITLMFVGRHGGELELSSASIATSFSAVTGFTIMLGLASTMETLCGQAYGAKKYHLLGVYLQAAWIVGFAVGVGVLCLWLNMETILKAAGQDPVIARMAAKYLIYMVPGVFGAALIQPIVKYLQSQSVVIPLLVIAILTVIIHIIACQIIIGTLNFGYTGGAVSTTFSYTCMLMLSCVYTWGSGKFHKTWTGFTWDAFSYVGVYLKLAVPSTCMLCLEYWTVEFLVLAAGLLPNPELQLSLLAIGLNTTNLAFNVPLGLSAAVSTRVANELGAYRPLAAKLAGKVIFGISISCAICIATSMILARHIWGKAFSNVEEVISSVADLMPLIAISAIFDGIQGVLSGIARGSGRQDMGAIINLTAFYIVGLPSGLFFGFVWEMSGKGLWIGLLLGQCLQSLLMLVLVTTMDWEKMSEEAMKRIHSYHLLPTTEKN